MYSKFEGIAEEKKQRIIEACIAEFSQNGYQNASTNSIVKNAEISKGILFHYFGSKKSLYLYVLDYVLEFFMAKIFDDTMNLPTDFFERAMQIGIIKLKIAHQFPEMYKLVLQAFTHTPEELQQEMQERYAELYERNIPILFKDIDTSKFRPDLDQGKAMELLGFVLEGVSNKFFKIITDMSVDEIMSRQEGLTQEYMEYFTILKKGVYQ